MSSCKLSRPTRRNTTFSCAKHCHTAPEWSFCVVGDKHQCRPADNDSCASTAQSQTQEEGSQAPAKSNHDPEASGQVAQPEVRARPDVESYGTASHPLCRRQRPRCCMLFSITARHTEVHRRRQVLAIASTLQAPAHSSQLRDRTKYHLGSPRRLPQFREFCLSLPVRRQIGICVLPDGE